MQYANFKSMDRSEDILSNNIFNLKVPSWVSRVLFKPNMTINTTYQQFKTAMEFSRLPAPAFVNTVNKPIQKKKSHFELRNKIGSILADFASPNLNIYSARSFYLDSKISLFNDTSDSVLPDMLDNIQNPFYKDQPPFYTHNKNQICINGPFDKHVREYLRCLNVSLKP